MKVLVVTNGHGEDQLAVCLVQALQKHRPEVNVEAIPLVGEGHRLEAASLAIPGPRVIMPSGGLVRPQPAAVWRDLRAGLIGQMRRQMKFVSSRRHKVDAVIAVGDVFAGWVAGRGVPDKRLVLVATAKSEYIHGHSAIEARWMRQRCEHVFPRDEPTATALREAGVAATWVGNLMMDALTITGRRFVSPDEGAVVGLLPGSRADAYVNLLDLADVMRYLATHTLEISDGGAGDGVGYIGLVPLAPGLDVERVVSKLAPRGWTADDADSDIYPGVQLTNGGATIRVIEGAFGDVLAAADIVVGLAGTANEQAAGLGKPVIAFPGPGVQFGPRFLRAQQRLLGDALKVVPADPAAVATAIVKITNDERLRKHMAAVGRERMGTPGAARRMAEAIAALWQVGSK